MLRIFRLLDLYCICHLQGGYSDIGSGPLGTCVSDGNCASTDPLRWIMWLRRRFVGKEAKPECVQFISVLTFEVVGKFVCFDVRFLLLFYTNREDGATLEEIRHVMRLKSRNSKLHIR
jgi:hypothetical protein